MFLNQFYIFANKLLLYFFICYSFTRHENPLKIFLYGSTLPWKVRETDPPLPLPPRKLRSIPWGWYEYFLFLYNVNLLEKQPMIFDVIIIIVLMRKIVTLNSPAESPMFDWQSSKSWSWRAATCVLKLGSWAFSGREETEFL